MKPAGEPDMSHRDFVITFAFLLALNGLATVGMTCVALIWLGG